MSDTAPNDNLRLERRLLLWLPVALVLLLILGFAVALNRPQPQGMVLAQLDNTLERRAMPAFTLAGVDDTGPIRGLSQADVLASKTPFTLVNFFASWCAPCRVEHPYLLALARRDDLSIMGIAYRDRPMAAADYLIKAGNPFDHAGLDPTGTAALGFGITGMPETFVIDQQGMIRFRFQGAITDLQVNQLEEILAKLRLEAEAS
ncbi:MAG: DsbE family thiol:disulfide interchange protein [Pseudomonadota bacterium]